MKSILDPNWEARLDQLAREDVLLAFDFDGTLAPIVPDPPAARMRDRTCALLRVAALLYPTAVISGRSRADVAARVARVPLVAIVGSHGAEAGFGPLDLAVRRRVAAWRDAIRAPIESLPGVVVEDNGFSLSVHYRHAPSRASARRAITAALSALPDARVVPGRAVVTAAPAASPNKGEAVQALLARTGRAAAVFVGDDRTDEDAFRAPGVALGVRVGRTARTGAHAYLPDQAGIDELLRRLIRARRKAQGLAGDLEGLERVLAVR
ncbi:MAG TPA: trehalose-phosphatase [Anaeromyxobacter sp.]|nr:trehalose-phosphatase [Anaeromyxobacter sp.]